MTSALSEISALVTGGTSGIGRAAAVELARLGARVAVSGRDQQRGNEVVEEIGTAGGSADFIAADLRDAASARTLAGRAVEAHPRSAAAIADSRASTGSISPNQTISGRKPPTGL